MATLSPPFLDADRLVLHAPPRTMTEAQFFDFCQLNAPWRIERTSTGEVIIMPPAGAESGRRNSKIGARLALWSEKDGTGETFDSSAGFTLPSGATRSPDASWIRREHWEALDPADRKKFAHICPDFVVELRSDTDRLPDLQLKMQEYLDNGAHLGWLIDPQNRCVEVYRPGQTVQVLEDPPDVSADPELPGFVLDLGPVWA